MSSFTHKGHHFASFLTEHAQEVDQRSSCGQKAPRIKAPAKKDETVTDTFHLYAEGLWLELHNDEPIQLVKAIICRADTNEKVVQQNFALPKGKSSFFWNLTKALWPEDMYVLLIRGEKHLLQWKFP
ncbi:hypothetical protein [Pontibacter brevis]